VVARVGYGCHHCCGGLLTSLQLSVVSVLVPMMVFNVVWLSITNL
jgi:hypothetical protein